MWSIQRKPRELQNSCFCLLDLLSGSKGETQLFLSCWLEWLLSDVMKIYVSAPFSGAGHLRSHVLFQYLWSYHGFSQFHHGPSLVRRWGSEQRRDPFALREQLTVQFRRDSKKDLKILKGNKWNILNIQVYVLLSVECLEMREITTMTSFSSCRAGTVLQPRGTLALMKQPTLFARWNRPGRRKAEAQAHLQRLWCKCWNLVINIFKHSKDKKSDLELPLLVWPWQVGWRVGTSFSW